jgi:hypothetical protein
MMDIIANDDDRWEPKRTDLLPETERRGWEEERATPPNVTDPAVVYRQPKTATARWQRSVLIIATLSALSWAAIILLVIAALSAL